MPDAAKSSTPPPIADRLERALQAREPLFDGDHRSAFRLFNGFFEGSRKLAIDLYATTLVAHVYSERPGEEAAPVDAALAFLRDRLPFVRAGIVKRRSGRTAAERRGGLVFGSDPDSEVREHGVLYAVDLTMNRDASLYLDTRGLRRWAIGNLAAKSVLNTFAYTGSLGVAACAGGASEVVQLDLNGRFLDLAKRSCGLNDFEVRDRDFLIGNFFPQISRLKRTGRRFDCVLIDPPFFASSAQGDVDLGSDSARLIDKVRPLVNDGGCIVAINNAIFLSGAAYMTSLEALCADGYLDMEAIVPVPLDFTGYPATIVDAPITDPAPFNHSTKIAILRVRRKHASP